MAKKRKEKEREVIAAYPNRRPYGAKFVFLLEKHTDFNIDGECIFLVSPEVHLRIKPKESVHDNGSGWEIFVEGFSTAGEAEQIGLKVVLGFLWSAIQGHYSARLLYHTPLPCVVYNRTQSQRKATSSLMTFSTSRGINNIFEPLDIVVSSNKAVDPRLLVALEIFASARLETTERARFVGIVSAIEPIAIQETYEDEKLNTLLSEFKQLLENSGVEQSLKSSVRGRIEQLKLESVSRAIRRLVKDTLPDDPDAKDIIEESYGLRSKILHEGLTDADLQEKSREAEETIRKILEVKILQYAKN